jgi:hypothetical protein
VALSHPECLDGELLDEKNGRQYIRIEMNVEMPLAMKANGISGSGVRVREPVLVAIGGNYPWASPTFYLRPDFPRSFPHLQPGTAEDLPRPCLVDGPQDEFFLQFGLVEYGIFHLVEQLAVWLRKAAICNLIDPVQGWEPIFRRTFADMLVFDAEAARAPIAKSGGWTVWKAMFGRNGSANDVLGDGASCWLRSDGEATPLKQKANDDGFSTQQIDAGRTGGYSVIALIGPDKLPSGKPRISADYYPESVTCVADLAARAAELGCTRGLDGFLASLERSFAGLLLPAPIPIGIVFGARRPCHLIGTKSDIELLPYVVEIRANRKRSSLFALGGAEPAAPAVHHQALTSSLLQTVSDAPARPAIALLGCGSVGSKLAFHAARSGQAVVAVSDNGRLQAHNMARHALGAEHLGDLKAEALARELVALGQQTLAHSHELADGLRDGARRKLSLPSAARLAINATASLSVRESLTMAGDHHRSMGFVEAALVGRGRGAYLLADGRGHNPNHCDLIAELYATLRPEDPMSHLMFDPDQGLSPIQIGQGCGSFTMPMDDARLSGMTAGLAHEIARAQNKPSRDGLIVTATSDDDSPATIWTRQVVPPFETVAIDGSDGWTLRISSRVADRIRAEAKAHGRVETGGIMIGLASARLKTLTVVDLLDAPPDSQRSASLFVLGTQGLHAAIAQRHADSGSSLFDVGTWHSHLADVRPSPTDWRTADDLAVGRTPPSVLLISTPRRFHALVSKRDLR